ncbi:hypothetical protein QTP81_13700 [Alteromonas sp. ASW11-36]|uniref:Uncharacterized protein n=1 Tax=Alteromonas arenosi TaxID=3055817 RepID=A0ABT7SZN9_9ALTE|nr:hypothetical protein [Alteromonas sp. ASW11-36]MDM7861650.1 hypothetical protein [Alteromonas sp. ASW11-36]
MGKNSVKYVTIVGAGALLAHAGLGIYNSKITLKGGTTLTFADDTVSFILLVLIEIVVSAYVFWAFVIKEGKEEQRADDV